MEDKWMILGIIVEFFARLLAFITVWVIITICLWLVDNWFGAYMLNQDRKTLWEMFKVWFDMVSQLKLF